MTASSSDIAIRSTFVGTPFGKRTVSGVLAGGNFGASPEVHAAGKMPNSVPGPICPCAVSACHATAMRLYSTYWHVIVPLVFPPLFAPQSSTRARRGQGDWQPCDDQARSRGTPPAGRQDVNAALAERRESRGHGLSALKAIASMESSLTPSSNYTRGDAIQGAFPDRALGVGAHRTRRQHLQRPRQRDGDGASG